MNGIRLLIYLLQLAFVLGDNADSYKNCRIYKVTDSGEHHIPRLELLQRKVSLLSERHAVQNNRSVTVRTYLVPRREERNFVRILRFFKTDFSISVPDLRQAIRREKISNRTDHTKRSHTGSSYSNDIYYSYDEMLLYLDYVKTIRNPFTNDSLVRLEKIGRSYEGRPMYLVKISSDHSARKPVILFEAGIHAREWSAPAAALHVIFQLAENFTGNLEVLRNIDFYVIPMSNPDGYEYSRNKMRLWRKTRSQFYSVYHGVDGNRNFGFHWGEEGTSRDPKSDIFIGPQPFSEPETRHIRDVGRKYVSRIKAFVSIHAFGPLIVYPWSYKKTLQPAPNTPEMHRIALKAAAAIKKVRSTEYDVGCSSHLMYPAAGGSDDYFKAVLRVPLSYTFELSSDGEDNFIIPNSKLPGIVTEVFEGFKVIARSAAEF